MAGFELGLAFSVFGVFSAIFFAIAAYIIRSPNSGIFRFMFLSMGLLCLIFTAGNMAYLARATNGTAEDISLLAPTFDYVLYSLSAIFALFVVYFVLGLIVGGVQFAMSFLSDDGMQLKKGRFNDGEDRIIKY